MLPVCCAWAGGGLVRSLRVEHPCSWITRTRTRIRTRAHAHADTGAREVSVREDKTFAARQRIAGKKNPPPPPVPIVTNLQDLRKKHQKLAGSGGDVSYVPRADPDHVLLLAREAALPVSKGSAGTATAAAHCKALSTVVYYSRAVHTWTLGRIVQAMTPDEVGEEIDRKGASGNREGEWFWLEYEDATGPALQAEPLEDIVAAATRSPPELFFYSPGTAFKGEGLEGKWWMESQEWERGGTLNWAQCCACRAWRVIQDVATYEILRQNPVLFNCSQLHEKGCNGRPSHEEERYMPELRQVHRRARRRLTPEDNAAQKNDKPPKRRKC